MLLSAAPILGATYNGSGTSFWTKIFRKEQKSETARRVMFVWNGVFRVRKLVLASSRIAGAMPTYQS
jgi:hypothetical protein